MKKILSSAAIFTLILTLTIQTTFAAFSDLNSFHKNYNAIIYLEDNDILNGYSDGTFKPDNKVNRAEFLKITLEGSNIPLDVSRGASIPFSDTDKLQWYMPYVTKAYTEGWVVGYEDGTFRPEQTINKVEALKIIGEVQEWELSTNIKNSPYLDIPADEWFTPYVVYAHDHEFLEETGDYLSPGLDMTRANISEVVYRTFIEDLGILRDEPEDDTAEEVIDDTEDEEDEPEENVDTEDYSNISKSKFTGVTLVENIPNTYYKNEVYVMEGNVSSSTKTDVTVLLDPDNNSDDDYILFTGEVTNKHFEIPVHFRESGNYNLGIIPGSNGETIIEEISVLSSLPSPSENKDSLNEAKSIKLLYEDDKTYVSFSTPIFSLKKLTFKQGSKKVEYISRQDLNEITVDYADFENFKEGDTTYYIETAELKLKKPLQIGSNFEKSSTKSFTAVEHTYDDIDFDKITGNPPDTLSSSSKDISFLGTLKTDVQKDGYVITPDGFVETVVLQSVSSTSDYYGTEILNSGSDYKFEYNPSENGRFIVEISDKAGLPIVNHPVYIGGGIPLLPDYFDLNARNFFSGTFSLNNLRNELLDLINEARADHGLSSVSTSSPLNDLAQAHSNDMVADNFFGHINTEDETPEDRKIAAGITGSVSENIAKDVSIKFGHYGLMRSASHRENILRSDWTTVGLGITQDEGYLYITEEFSSGEIEEQDLEAYKNELISSIDTIRIASGLSQLSYDSTLETASIYLNNKIIFEDASLTSEDLSEALELYGITGNTQYIGRSYNIWSVILSSILNDEIDLIKGDWSSIGADIQIDTGGIIHATFMLNN